MLNKSIIVIGSSNTDMVVKTKRFPAPGETVLGGDFLMTPGGKGANQAVAAARLGGQVVFVCKVGNDLFGSQSAELFKSEGIDISHVLLDEEKPSGVALITVDEKAENSIVVASGANAALLPQDIVGMEQVLKAGSFVLMQLEIPLETVVYVAGLVRDNGGYVILNPAPACELPEELYGKLELITPNEKEATMISGVVVNNLETAKEAALCICAKGVKNVVITMGAKGALVYDGKCFTHIPASLVKAVDTTAAGDVFNGALAVALNEGLSLVDAAKFASKSSAIAVTRLGAQASAPYREELKEFAFIRP